MRIRSRHRVLSASAFVAAVLSKPILAATGELCVSAAAPANPPQTPAPAQTSVRTTPPAEVERSEKPKSDDTNVATLETLVISADRGVPLTYPGGRDVIERETTETYPDQSPSTVLRRTPGVFVLPENGNDSRINVGIRGNDPRRSGFTAVMVDGIPVSEAPYGNTDIDGLPIAFERVFRTDVIRGGASIRYGPNSAGGIINFLTQPVPDSTLLRLGTRVGSDGDYGASIATGGTWDRFGVLVDGVVKGGDGFRENGEYQDFDGALKARYAISPTQWLQAYVSRFTEFDAEQPGGLTQAAYDADPKQSLRPGADFSLDFNRYVVDYTSDAGDGTSFQLKTWFQEGFRQLNDFRPVVAPFAVTRQQNSEFQAGAIEAIYTWENEWFGLPNKLFHSARYLAEKNDVLYVRTPIAGGPPITPFELDAEFKGNAFSLFNEDVITLTPGLDLGIGFRLENITMHGRSTADGNEIVQDYSEFLPEANLTWSVAPETALYASYQRGFYPPQYETGFDPASVLYAPTKAEHSDALELGLRSREIDGLEATLALFDNEFYDKIDFVILPDGTKVPVNTGHARAYGVEAGVNYDLGSLTSSLTGFSMYGTVTAQRTRIETGANEGNETPHAPHLLASWGAQYDHERSGLWARIGGSYSDDVFKDLANTTTASADGVTGPEPSYTLWDCALGWYQNPDRTGLALTAGVTNLFDEEYFRRFTTGIFPGAPRQEFATVSYTFSF